MHDLELQLVPVYPKNRSLWTDMDRTGKCCWGINGYFILIRLSSSISVVPLLLDLSFPALMSSKIYYFFLKSLNHLGLFSVGIKGI